ncbi:MAG: 3-oxoacyl-[acyl-carrier protein] reductase, partial [uncultured Thermoleophilia bacterium]
GHRNRSAAGRPPAGVPGAVAARAGPRERDGPEARLRRGLLHGLGPADGQGGRDHGRGQRHRSRRRPGLRPGGRGRRDLLPRGGGRRRRDRPRRDGRRTPRRHGAGRHHRRGALPHGHPPGRRRVRADRRARQQRRLPDGPRGRHPGDPVRGDRARLPDEHHGHVLAVPGGDPAHAAGLLDHQRRLRGGVHAEAPAPPLRDDQGRDRDVHQGTRAGAGGEGHPRQRRGAGAGVDAAHPDVDAARGGQDLRLHHAARPSGPAARAGRRLRLPGLRRGELHGRHGDRRPRRHADAV